MNQPDECKNCQYYYPECFEIKSCFMGYDIFIPRIINCRCSIVPLPIIQLWEKIKPVNIFSNN